MSPGLAKKRTCVWCVVAGLHLEPPTNRWCVWGEPPASGMDYAVIRGPSTCDYSRGFKISSNRSNHCISFLDPTIWKGAAAHEDMTLVAELVQSTGALRTLAVAGLLFTLSIACAYVLFVPNSLKVVCLASLVRSMLSSLRRIEGDEICLQAHEDIR